MEVARWSLRSAHYLNVLEFADGTVPEWEYKEQSRTSNRMARKLFKVPALLDPNDQADHNYPGQIIVAYAEGDGQGPQDIIFEGEPTQEMEPLNAAAQAITDSLRAKWEHPIESLAPNGKMDAQESAFMSKMMEAFARMAPPPAIDNTTVPKAEFDALKAKMEEIQAMLASGAIKAAPATEARRV